MQYITMKEMREYILSQPDEKPINMKVNHTPVGDEQCGCLMVQYAHEVLKMNDVNCGWCSINNHSGKQAHTDFTMGRLIDGGFANHSKTFGELKKCLIPTG